MKRFIAVLLLACCLLTACGKKPSAPEKLSVSKYMLARQNAYQTHL